EGLAGCETRWAAERSGAMEPARDAQIPADAGRRAADAEHVAGFEGEGRSCGDRASVHGELERGAEDDAGGSVPGFDRRAREGHFDREGVRRVADEGVPKGQCESVRGPADRDPQRPAARPAVVHQQREQPGVAEDETHANGLRVNPRASSASRTALVNPTACGLSPWTQIVRTPFSRISHSTCFTASSGSWTNASGSVRGTSDPSGR